MKEFFYYNITIKSSNGSVTEKSPHFDTLYDAYTDRRNRETNYFDCKCSPIFREIEEKV